ncbi:DUF1758 domain-containing protein [Trichonephila clavata]|uniref:DUF1758 domain-containing protein n=1 Tax=Trichonephila clavata TaxID=2740835 RepID=A0A8X6GFW6_TRICU|nr:DUF1758 domain-containing protein [Trichonephila clavata]
MLLIIIITLLCGIFLILFRYSLWRQRFCKLIPGNKFSFFNFLGDLSEVITYERTDDKYALHNHFMKVIKSWIERHKGKQLFCVWLLYRPIVLFVRADAVKELLKDTKMFEKSPLYETMKILLGTGLVTSSVEKWKPRRKLLNPCFHHDMLKGYFEVFNIHSRKLVNFLKQETERDFSDIKKPITRSALDIICAFNKTDSTTDYIVLKSKLDSIKSIIKELDILQNDYCALPDKVNLKDSLDTLSDLQDEAEETKALEVRYENTRALVDIHIAEILSINKLNSENPSQIRSIVDKVRNHLRSLKNLNFESNHLSDAIILHVLSNKFDKESQRLLHLSLTTTKVPSLDEFISFLELRCIQLEAVIKPPEIAAKNVPIKNKTTSGLINPRCKSFLTKEKLKPTTSVEPIQRQKNV